MAIETTAQDSRTLAAWVGSRARFERVVKSIDKAVESSKTTELDALARNVAEAQDAELARNVAEAQDAELARNVAEAQGAELQRQKSSGGDESDYNRMKARLQWPIWPHETEPMIEAKWQVKLEVETSELSMTYKGAVDDVLDEVDEAKITTARLTVPGVKVTFSVKEGVKLEVRGEDPAWVVSSTQQIDSEIATNVPKWAWLRTGWGSLMYYFAALAATVLVWLPMLEPNDDYSLVRQVVMALVIAASLIAPTLTLAIDSAVRRWVLPGFELLEGGWDKGRGARALGVVGAVGLSVIVPLMLALLS